MVLYRLLWEPNTSRRFEAWNSLCLLNHHPKIPWLHAGDFNELAKQDEKLGGNLEPCSNAVV